MKEHRMRSCLPVHEIGPYMEGWTRKKPGFVTVEAIGKSGGYDILKAVFTDPSVSDEDKQVVLLTAQHSIELSGVTTLLSVGNFLASDREEAAELLKHLIVVMIPCSNPYSYSKQDPAYQFKNKAGICECFAFDCNGVIYDEETAPAAHAIKRVLDEYRPELMLDAHGVWYQNQLVVPCLCNSANISSRSYNNEFVRQIQQAGLDAGYPTMNFDHMEVLLQTDPKCPDKNKHFFSSGTNNQAQTYTYVQYHSLVGSFEVAFEGSSVAQIIKALEIGCGTWGGEYYPGYPTRTVVSPQGHNSIRAYGKTAAQRRESRAELWKDRNRICLGLGHPEMPGLSSAVIVTDPYGIKTVYENAGSLTSTIEKMPDHPAVKKEKMLELLDDHYPQRVDLSGGCSSADEGSLDIKHGMTIRMGLPFADAHDYEVYYNGVALSEDEQDGYTVVRYNNWVYIDLHIPPAKVCPFAVAMVKYDCTIPPVGIMEF